MKRFVTVIIYIFILMSPMLSAAQDGKVKSSIFKPLQGYKNPAGFLDALFASSNFSMSQSYSMSFGSFGGRSYNQGLYLNTINFQLSQPLFMQVRVGYAHQPFSMAGSRPDKGEFFLQRAMLQYNLSDKTKITLEYQSIPASMFSPYYLRR